MILKNFIDFCDFYPFLPPTSVLFCSGNALSIYQCGDSGEGGASGHAFPQHWHRLQPAQLPDTGPDDDDDDNSGDADDSYDADDCDDDDDDNLGDDDDDYNLGDDDDSFDNEDNEDYNDIGA